MRIDHIQLFSELAWGLGWRKEDLVLALWAYFDESGHTSDKTVVAFSLAGLRATCEQWTRFSLAWDNALAQEKVLSFHMKMLYSRSEKSPHKDWSSEKREKFLMALIELIREHLGEHSAIGGADRVGKDGTWEGGFELTYYNAYRTCIHAALFNVPKTEKVHFVFALHEEVSSVVFRQYHAAMAEAYKRWKNDSRIGSMSVARAASLAPLQAADLIAWHVRRHQQKPKEPRPSWDAIMALRPHFYP